MTDRVRSEAFPRAIGFTSTRRKPTTPCAACAWSCTISRARAVSEGHEKRIDSGGVMGDLPLALGTVVSQYLDQLGIRDHVGQPGADERRPPRRPVK